MAKKPMSAAKKQEKEALKAMKAKKQRFYRILSVACALLVAGAVFLVMYLNRESISLAVSNIGLRAVSEDRDGNLLVRGDEPAYLVSPSCYEPSLKGNAAAYFKERPEKKLYAVDTFDTDLYLAAEYTGTGTVLYHAPSVTLPSLQELKPSMLRICDSTYGNPLEMYCVTDQKLINEAIRLFTEEDTVEIPFESYLTSLDLKFYSENWPMFYYNLTYFICPDGGYIFDRYTKQCVFVGDLFSEYSIE